MTLRGGTVRAYLQGLREIGAVTGSTEHTYREPLVTFLTAAAEELGFGAVRIRGELRLHEVGQPDLQVVNSDGRAIGYGETKPIGSAADFARVLESEQVDRYRRSLENLLVTDFLHFTLFRPVVGRMDVTLVETPGRLTAGSPAVSTAQLTQLSALLSAFFSATAPAATTAEQLADGLARRTTLLRDAIRELLGPTTEQGEPLRRLWDFYRRSLMSDMEADDFADTYAQTLVYALFLARLEGGPATELDAAWKALPAEAPILRSAIEPLRAAGKLPDALSVWLVDALHLLASVPDAVISSIGHPSAGMPDPILYFYEHFLAAYDKVERIRRGVYYTPRPLVDYLVRAVDDSLKRDFRKATGLGDQGVSLLDPAVGTGTFVLAAAQQAVGNVASVLGSGAVRAVLEEQVLRNFYGFELLPAPYTIAHVKMALFARDHHVSFANKRAQIYLTNTLGDPVARADDGGLLAFFVPGLIEEAAAAERVKSDERILVIIGNPPWSATSHNKQPEIERLFAAWKTVDGRPIEDARIALNDDYLKFLRWAVWKLLEQPGAAGQGIIAFVTNHGFINGRIHRGVRKALLDAFDEIYVFNLQGNQRLWVRGVKDEKVFPDVQQGVALSVLIRRPGAHAGPATVHYRELRGTRPAKYAAAQTARLADADWQTLKPEAPFYSFAPASVDDRYDAWPAVPEIFPVSTSGVQSSRDDLVSDVAPAPIAERMRIVADRAIPDEAVKERYGIQENPRWSWPEHRRAFAGFEAGRIIPWLYRLFDRRFIYWDPVLVEWPRTKVMRHLLPLPFGLGGEDRLALVVQRVNKKPVSAMATVSRGTACSDTLTNWAHVYPLHLAEASDETHLLPSSGEWRENLAPGLAVRLVEAYGRRPSVEEVAWYVFGVLSAPAYRERFAAPLAIDHPRIPFPAQAAPFEAMAGLGETLGRAHLLEAPVDPDIRYLGEGNDRVETIRHAPDSGEVWINATQRFTGVTADAWAWGLGFRPLEHFLTDRKGRRLDLAQIENFQRAIHAVRESIRLGPRLDATLAAILSDPLDTSGRSSEGFAQPSTSS